MAFGKGEGAFPAPKEVNKITTSATNGDGLLTRTLATPYGFMTSTAQKAYVVRIRSIPPPTLIATAYENLILPPSRLAHPVSILWLYLLSAETRVNEMLLRTLRER